MVDVSEPESPEVVGCNLNATGMEEGLLVLRPTGRIGDALRPLSAGDTPVWW